MKKMKSIQISDYMSTTASYENSRRQMIITVWIVTHSLEQKKQHNV